MEEKILKLRSEGKTYNQIQKELGCSKSLISYYCGEGQKEKNLKRRQKNYNSHFIGNKILKFRKRELQNKSDDFQRERIGRYTPNKKRKWQTNGKHLPKTFGYKNVIEKFGINTTCYLTGRAINLVEPKTYNFDHVVPVSRGGDSTIENLGIACSVANRAKSDMMVNEFLALCKEVLEHNGYKVEKHEC